MRLAVDNSNPQPGATYEQYRAALTSGKRMRCHRTSGGAVGIRQPDGEHVSWRWIVLCHDCVEDVRAQGYLVLAAARLDPLAELREVMADPLEEPPSSPRLPVTVARYPGEVPGVRPGDRRERTDRDVRWPVAARAVRVVSGIHDGHRLERGRRLDYGRNLTREDYCQGCGLMASTVITGRLESGLSGPPGSSGPYCQKIRHAPGVLFSTYESHTFTSRSTGKLSYR